MAQAQEGGEQMSGDLVERLRLLAAEYPHMPLGEAADEIERLEEENAIMAQACGVSELRRQECIKRGEEIERLKELLRDLEYEIKDTDREIERLRDEVKSFNSEHYEQKAEIERLNKQFVG